MHGPATFGPLGLFWRNYGNRVEILKLKSKKRARKEVDIEGEIEAESDEEEQDDS